MTLDKPKPSLSLSKALLAVIHCSFSASYLVAYLEEEEEYIPPPSERTWCKIPFSAPSQPVTKGRIQTCLRGPCGTDSLCRALRQCCSSSEVLTDAAVSR